MAVGCVLAGGMSISAVSECASGSMRVKKGSGMSEKVLFLDLVQKEEAEAAPPRVRLAVRAYPADSEGFVSLTPECDTMEEFEQAVGNLSKNLANALQSARDKFQEYQIQASGETAVTRPQSREEVWQSLEECASIEEMRGIFNSLGRQKRQEVADFVLTQLNIFKGPASTFSQHYNEEEYLLE